MLYRKKPVIVEENLGGKYTYYKRTKKGEAFQLDDRPLDFWKHYPNPNPDLCEIKTLEGAIIVRVLKGDHTIRGISGEIYPFDLDIFHIRRGAR